MSISYTIDNDWIDTLQQAGLDSFERAFAYADGKPLSKKSHSVTYTKLLPDGTRIFIKQDAWTGWRPIARALIRMQKPLPAVGRERAKMRKLEQLGFNTAKVISYGEKRRCGLPHQAVMLSLCVPGIALDTIADAQFRDEAATEARKVLKHLQELGCDWGRDCKPEHFFVTKELKVTIIDVERMKFRRKALDETTCRQQLTRFDALLNNAPRQ